MYTSNYKNYYLLLLIHVLYFIEFSMCYEASGLQWFFEWKVAALLTKGLEVTVSFGTLYEQKDVLTL